MFKPLYTNSLRTAISQNETEQYYESRLKKIACKNGIEWMIRENFDGSALNEKCAKELCEKYGTDCVGWVLANTVQHYSTDGRFRPHTKEWAEKFNIPNTIEDMSGEYCVRSHPEIVNGLVDQYRTHIQSLDVLDYASCVYGSQNDNFEGKLMILNPSALKEEFRNSKNQYFFAESGFGCSPDELGGKVFGKFLVDGESTQFRRSDFFGEADSYGLPDWAKEKLQELTVICEDNTEISLQ